ncbi:MAG TPA: serine/threonine-protein kinase [Haliangiales bacterium]|nr:serine/threonine-protein kinase [Haliangiales bacterium]
MTAELPRPIVLADRFTLVRQIATGGMAEIFLARQKGLPGLEKEIVIKLLKERYRTDVRVVEMFLNEARIGTVLNHPNIVHVYDIGEHDATPFIAMEYIRGEELSQLCRRGVEMGYFLPVDHAVDLCRQAAEGMAAFHGKRDDAGHPLAIVHRDVSPSNMMVTPDGVMKLIDFGIAKASWRDRRDKTEMEKLVPGKYNYMSPEQVRGEKVDHRTDIFSLGIVLYELTVGKRLFKGRPEEVIQRIVRGKVKPPTFVRQKFPARLEQIVMRALEPNANDRYASALELATDLEEFLREAGRKSGPLRVAQYVDDLRALETGEKRPELVIAGEAWLDDDGEDVLDFDRSFSTVKREAPPKAAAAPAPVAPPAAPPPPASESLSGPVPLAVVSGPVAVLTPRRPAGDEEPTTVADEQRAAELSRSIDPEIGDDGPTDAVPLVPAMELGLSSEEITSKSDLPPPPSPLPSPLPSIVHVATSRDFTAPATPAALADLKPPPKAPAPTASAAKQLPPLDPVAEMAEDMSKTLEARPRPSPMAMRPVVLDTKEVPLDAATPMPRKRRRRRSGPQTPQTIDLMLPKKDERSELPDKDAPAADAAPSFSFGSSFVDRRARPSLKLPVTAIAVIVAFVLLIFLLTRV